MPAGNVTPASCAVLGRTRYALLPVEKEFGLRGIPYFKRVTALHENESDLADDCSMALGTSQQLKTDDATALLTVHSSKGLEFEVCLSYIPHPTRQNHVV
jgi:DNA helicase-2/ATP-dependent DNA helicase PcrA